MLLRTFLSELAHIYFSIIVSHKDGATSDPGQGCMTRALLPCFLKWGATGAQVSLHMKRVRPGSVRTPSVRA